MKSFSTRYGKNWQTSFLACLLFLFVSYTANAQQYGCYNSNTYTGLNMATITPTCSSQSYTTLPSTGNLQFTAAGGVQYNFTCSGSGWSQNDLTMYSWTGSTWTVYTQSTNGTLNVTPPANSYRIMATNGQGCFPAWLSNSATLTYVIPTAFTPGCGESTSEVCLGNSVTYSYTGSGVGSFYQYVYGWDAAGTNALSSSSSYSWPSNGGNPGSNPGHRLYVRAETNNGGCVAYSTAINVLVDNTSSYGSWVYPTLYYCGSGATYTAAGTQVYQGATGTVGTLAWEYGLNCGSLSGSGGSGTTSPWNCCFPGNPNSVTLFATNGVCPQVSNCFTYTADGMVAPTGASISPAGPVCAPTSGNITLTYAGGSGGSISGGVLRWYSGSAPTNLTSGSYIATGQSASIAAPSSTTTYYCAWVDPCGYPTSAASATFTVVPVPTLTVTTASICQGSTTTVSPSTGGTWTSNNTAVATISGNTVGGVATGSTTMKYTTTASPGCPYNSPTITVTNLPTVSINAPTTFCTNATTTLNPSSGGTWVSNNTAAATVVSTTGAVTGATTGGSASFTFTSSTAPNCANTTGSVVVTPLPTIFGVTGGGTFCLGSGSTVGLAGSQTGVNYQLVLNGTTNVGSPVAGTNSPITFGSQGTVGTYTVVATTTTNSCVQKMSGSAVVTELSPNVTNTNASGIGTNGATLNGTD